MSVRRNPVPALVAVLVVVASGCITPPGPGGGVPACPARGVSTLSSSGSSLVRGLSADGAWIVTSNINGDDTLLTLRRVDGLVPPVQVTSLVGLDSGDSEFARLRVGVTEDGEQVVVDGARWQRSTGTLVPLTPPVPGAVLLNQSLDRSRTAWTVPGDPTILVTDSFTDGVLPWQHVALDGSSPSGRFVVSSPSADVADLVDLATGTSASLAPALAAIAAADPTAVVNAVESAAVSPDGTVVALETVRNLGGLDPTRHLWAWDTTTEQLRDLGLDRGTVQVADDGTVVYADRATLVGSIRASLADGSSRTVYSGTNVISIGRTFAASTDLRTLAFVAATQPLGATSAVYLSRCR